jgi:hypothetical protein
MDNYCFQCRFADLFEFDDYEVDILSKMDSYDAWEYITKTYIGNGEIVVDAVCRRYPPIYSEKGKWRFPKIDVMSDWCGEFQPRPCYQGKEAA